MIVAAPRRFDEAGFEKMLDALRLLPGAAPSVLDLSETRFIDPYGLLCLLSIGCSSSFRRGHIWGLILPRSRRVLAFMERNGALDMLEELFIVQDSSGEEGKDGREGEGRSFLEVSTIGENADIHRVVARVKARADRILVGRLGYNTLAADRFTVALAEICQNIVDHSLAEGLVSAQIYFDRRESGRPMLRLAVSDVGRGIRRSLASRYRTDFPGTWSDRTAVRLAFRRGVSRFSDSGRGLGLKLVVEMVRRWGGRFFLRSGTAAYAVCPSWGPRPRRGGLNDFPGTQINMFLPAAGLTLGEENLAAER